MTTVTTYTADFREWQEILRSRACSAPCNPEQAAARSWIAHKGLCPNILDMLEADAQVSSIHPDCTVKPPGKGPRTRCDALEVAGRERTSTLVIDPTLGRAFRQTIAKWWAKSSSESSVCNHAVRIEGICEKLGLGEEYSPDGSLKYRFFYKAYAAIMLAEALGGDEAVLIVQSLTDTSPEFTDFERFCDLFSVTTDAGCLSAPISCVGVPLRVGWATCSVLGAVDS